MHPEKYPIIHSGQRSVWLHLLKMPHLVQSTKLQSMKQRLRELEKLPLIKPGDLQILTTKRILREKISELEQNEAADLETPHKNSGKAYESVLLVT